MFEESTKIISGIACSPFLVLMIVDLSRRRLGTPVGERLRVQVPVRAIRLLPDIRELRIIADRLLFGFEPALEK
jgi:hypothetical protein